MGTTEKRYRASSRHSLPIGRLKLMNANREKDVLAVIIKTQQCQCNMSQQLQGAANRDKCMITEIR